MSETIRPSAEARLGNRARKALAALDRWERRAAEAQEQAEAARQELTAIHAKTCERFGRDIPADALLLDVLESVDVEDGDRWVWRGTHNNKNLPTLRVRRAAGRQNGEVGVCRYLAIELGVIAEDDFGTLYPVNGDTEDINPWHRTFRRSPVPIGNPERYRFTPGGRRQ